MKRSRFLYRILKRQTEIPLSANMHILLNAGTVPEKVSKHLMFDIVTLANQTIPPQKRIK